jgi:hypothetical protein
MLVGDEPPPARVDQPRPKRLIFAVRFGLGQLPGRYVSNFVWFATEN